MQISLPSGWRRGAASEDVLGGDSGPGGGLEVELEQGVVQCRCQVYGTAYYSPGKGSCFSWPLTAPRTRRGSHAPRRSGSCSRLADTPRPVVGQNYYSSSLIGQNYASSPLLKVRIIHYVHLLVSI